MNGYKDPPTLEGLPTVDDDEKLKQPKTPTLEGLPIVESSPISLKGKKYLRPNEIRSALRQAGWDEDKIPLMTAIGMAESNRDAQGRVKVASYNPGVGKGGKPTIEKSHGIWQINMHPSLGRKYDINRLRTDPVYNAKAALEIYKQQGLRAWGAYTDGRYKQFVKQASEGADIANDPETPDISMPEAQESPFAYRPAEDVNKGNVKDIDPAEFYGWKEADNEQADIDPYDFYGWKRPMGKLPQSKPSKPLPPIERDGLVYTREPLDETQASYDFQRTGKWGKLNYLGRRDGAFFFEDSDGNLIRGVLGEDGKTMTPQFEGVPKVLRYDDKTVLTKSEDQNQPVSGATRYEDAEGNTYLYDGKQTILEAPYEEKETKADYQEYLDATKQPDSVATRAEYASVRKAEGDNVRASMGVETAEYERYRQQVSDYLTANQPQPRGTMPAVPNHVITLQSGGRPSYVSPEAWYTEQVAANLAQRHDIPYLHALAFIEQMGVADQRGAGERYVVREDWVKGLEGGRFFYNDQHLDQLKAFSEELRRSGKETLAQRYGEGMYLDESTLRAYADLIGEDPIELANELVGSGRLFSEDEELYQDARVKRANLQDKIQGLTEKYALEDGGLKYASTAYLRALREVGLVSPEYFERMEQLEEQGKALALADSQGIAEDVLNMVDPAWDWFNWLFASNDAQLSSDLGKSLGHYLFGTTPPNVGSEKPAFTAAKPVDAEGRRAQAYRDKIFRTYKLMDGSKVVGPIGYAIQQKENQGREWNPIDRWKQIFREVGRSLNDIFTGSLAGVDVAYNEKLGGLFGANHVLKRTLGDEYVISFRNALEGINAIGAWIEGRPLPAPSTPGLLDDHPLWQVHEALTDALGEDQYLEGTKIGRATSALTSAMVFLALGRLTGGSKIGVAASGAAMEFPSIYKDLRSKPEKGSTRKQLSPDEALAWGWGVAAVSGGSEIFGVGSMWGRLVKLGAKLTDTGFKQAVKVIGANMLRETAEEMPQEFFQSSFVGAMNEALTDPKDQETFQRFFQVLPDHMSEAKTDALYAGFAALTLGGVGGAIVRHKVHRDIAKAIETMTPEEVARFQANLGIDERREADRIISEALKEGGLSAEAEGKWRKAMRETIELHTGASMIGQDLKPLTYAQKQAQQADPFARDLTRPEARQTPDASLTTPDLRGRLLPQGPLVMSTEYMAPDIGAFTRQGRDELGRFTSSSVGALVQPKRDAQGRFVINNEGFLDSMRKDGVDVRVPEAPETVQAQIDAIGSGNRQIVVIPHDIDGQPATNIPELHDLKVVTTGVGQVVYNPEITKEADIKSASRTDLARMQGILELDTDVSEDGVWLVASRRDGTELSSVYVSPENVQAQKDEMLKQFGTGLSSVQDDIVFRELTPMEAFNTIIPNRLEAQAKRAVEEAKVKKDQETKADKIEEGKKAQEKKEEESLDDIADEVLGDTATEEEFDTTPLESPPNIALHEVKDAPTQVTKADEDGYRTITWQNPDRSNPTEARLTAEDFEGMLDMSHKGTAKAVQGLGKNLAHVNILNVRFSPAGLATITLKPTVEKKGKKVRGKRVILSPVQLSSGTAKKKVEKKKTEKKKKQTEKKVKPLVTPEGEALRKARKEGKKRPSPKKPSEVKAPITTTVKRGDRALVGGKPVEVTTVRRGETGEKVVYFVKETGARGFLTLGEFAQESVRVGETLTWKPDPRKDKTVEGTLVISNDELKVRFERKGRKVTHKWNPDKYVPRGTPLKAIRDDELISQNQVSTPPQRGVGKDEKGYYIANLDDGGKPLNNKRYKTYEEAEGIAFPSYLRHSFQATEGELRTDVTRNIEKGLSRFAPVRVVTFESRGAYENVANHLGGYPDAIAFATEDTIYLSPDVDTRTAIHEAAHVLIHWGLNNSAEFSDYAVQEIEKILTPEQFKFLTDFVDESGYSPAERNEEITVEFLSDIASGYHPITGKIKQWFQSLLDWLGVPSVLSPNANFRQMARVLTGLRSGRVVTSSYAEAVEEMLKRAVAPVKRRFDRMANPAAETRDPIAPEIKHALSARGRRLGLSNAFEEVLWDRFGFKKKVSGNVAKLGEAIENAYNELINDLPSFAIQKLTDGYIKFEMNVAQELGHTDHVQHYRHMLENDSARNEGLRAVQDLQIEGMERWTSYLTENEDYTPAFKLYVMYEITRKYQQVAVQEDGTNKPSIRKRTKTTVNDFAPVHAGALADLQDSDEANFWEFYPEAISNAPIPEMQNAEDVGDGRWVVFEKGTDGSALSASVVGTPWCTANCGTATSQLSQGDFHVYYTQDANGEYNVPRIAVRMAQGKVAEVRGVATGQNIETDLEDIAVERVEGMEGGGRYLKIAKDMRRLTKLVKKQEAGKEFTVADLRFLYELDGQVKGFGYQSDPRLQEIQRKRVRKVDMAQVFNVTPEEVFVGRSFDEIPAQDLDKYRVAIITSRDPLPTRHRLKALVIRGRNNFQIRPEALNKLEHLVAHRVTVNVFGNGASVRIPKGLWRLTLHGLPSVTSNKVENVRLRGNLKGLRLFEVLNMSFDRVPEIEAYSVEVRGESDIDLSKTQADRLLVTNEATVRNFKADRLESLTVARYGKLLNSRVRETSHLAFRHTIAENVNGTRVDNVSNVIQATGGLKAIKRFTGTHLQIDSPTERIDLDNLPFSVDNSKLTSVHILGDYTDNYTGKLSLKGVVELDSLSLSDGWRVKDTQALKKIRIGRVSGHTHFDGQVSIEDLSVTLMSGTLKGVKELGSLPYYDYGQGSHKFPDLVKVGGHFNPELNSKNRFPKLESVDKLTIGHSTDFELMGQLKQANEINIGADANEYVDLSGIKKHLKKVTFSVSHSSNKVWNTLGSKSIGILKIGTGTGIDRPTPSLNQLEKVGALIEADSINAERQPEQLLMQDWGRLKELPVDIMVPPKLLPVIPDGMQVPDRVGLWRDVYGNSKSGLPPNVTKEEAFQTYQTRILQEHARVAERKAVRLKKFLESTDDIEDPPTLALAPDSHSPIAFNTNDLTDLEDGIGSTIIEGRVKLTPESGRLFTEALVLAGTHSRGKSIVGGAFVTPSNLSKTVDGLIALAEQLEQAGHANLADHVDQIQEQIIQAVEENRSTVVETLSEFLPHELLHQAGYQAGSESVLTQRLHDLSGFYNLHKAVINKAYQAFFKKQGYKNRSLKDKAILIEEMFAYIGTGEALRLGLEADEALNFLYEYFARFEATHGAEAISHFERFIDSQIMIAEAILKLRGSNETEQEATTEDQRTDGDMGRETAQEEDVGEDESEAVPYASTEGAEVLTRKLSKTLEKAGLEVPRRLYIVKGNAESLANADAHMKRLVKRGGLDEVFKYIHPKLWTRTSWGWRVSKEILSPEDAIIIRRTLKEIRRLVDKLEAQGEVQQAEELEQYRLNHVYQPLIEKYTLAGQMIQVAATFTDEVHDMQTYIRALMDDPSRAGLTARQKANLMHMANSILDANQQLETMYEAQEQIEVRVAEMEEATQETIMERFTDAETRQARSELPNNLGELIDGIEAQNPSLLKRALDKVLGKNWLVGRQMLNLAEAEEQDDRDDALRALADSDFEALVKVGAGILLDQKTGEFTLETFSADMMKLIRARRPDLEGEVSKVLFELFAASFNYRKGLLADTRKKNALKRLAQQYPGMSKVKLLEKLREKEDKTTMKRRISAMNRRIAKLLDKDPTPQQAKVLVRIEDITQKGRIRRLAEAIFLNAPELRGMLKNAHARDVKTAERVVKQAQAELKFESRRIQEIIAGDKESLRQLEVNATKLRAARSNEVKDLAHQLTTAKWSMAKKITVGILKRVSEMRAFMAAGDFSGAQRQGFIGTLMRPNLTFFGQGRQFVPNATQALAMFKQRMNWRMEQGDTEAIRQWNNAEKMAFVWKDWFGEKFLKTERQRSFQMLRSPWVTQMIVAMPYSGKAEGRFWSAMTDIENHPEFDIWTDIMGVEFAVAGQHENPEKIGEERIQTEYAKNYRFPAFLPFVGGRRLFPWLDWSERTWGAFLDTQRALLAHEYATMLQRNGIDPHAQAEQYRAFGWMINVATGKSDLKTRGEALKQMEKALKYANVLFAPSYAISRIQAAYMMQTFGHRVPYGEEAPFATKQMRRDVYRMNLYTLGLMSFLSAIGAIEWGLDDEKDYLWENDDFLKIKVGVPGYRAFGRYGILGGLTPVLRFQMRILYRTAMWGRYGMGLGPPPFRGRSATEDIEYNLTRYGRGKLSPTISLLADLWTGRDFLGRKTVWNDWRTYTGTSKFFDKANTLGITTAKDDDRFKDEEFMFMDSVILQRVLPLTVKEGVDGFAEAGILGTAFTLPAIWGWQSSLYKDKQLIDATPKNMRGLRSHYDVVELFLNGYKGKEAILVSKDEDTGEEIYRPLTKLEKEKLVKEFQRKYQFSASELARATYASVMEQYGIEIPNTPMPKKKTSKPLRLRR